MPENAPDPAGPDRDEDGPGREPVNQAGIVVGHRADDEPIITDRDPDPDREEPTTTDSGVAPEETSGS